VSAAYAEYQDIITNHISQSAFLKDLSARDRRKLYDKMKAYSEAFEQYLDDIEEYDKAQAVKQRRVQYIRPLS